MYYNHQQRAGAFPDKYLSMLIDGIDKSKTVIPPTLSRLEVYFK